MKHVRLLGLAAAIVAAGCGGGSDIDIMEEPPGPNCSAGGFRIEADGQVFYSCDEGVTVDDVAAGEDGNTCLGDAVRVTFPSDSGTPRVVYVCQTLGEADPGDVTALSAPMNYTVAHARVECACTLDDFGEAVCDQYEADNRSLSLLLGGCVNDLLVLVGPSPASFDDSVGCQLAARQDVADCISAIEVPAECNEEIRGQLLGESETCQIMFDDSACEQADVEVQQWQERLSRFAQLLGCPVVGWSSPTVTR